MTDSEHTHRTERLWTPWRMPYIGGSGREEGCIFCNRISDSRDAQSLILYRGQRCFAIMNLYPYNTGHIMLVPNEHAADPSELAPETLREMGELLPLFTDALTRVLDCDGFNVGLNIGSVAGAGVASHLHQHIVPRWEGDANFMPILASTMTIPELIPVTYGKIRAELQRHATSATTGTFAALNPSNEYVLTRNGSLPIVDLTTDQAVWQSIMLEMPDGISQATLTGWAGDDLVDPTETGTIALALEIEAEVELPHGWELAPMDDLASDPEAAGIVERANDLMAPANSQQGAFHQR